MVTWWAWTTSFILVFHLYCFRSLLIHCWILSSTHESPIHQVGLHYLLYFILILHLYILVNTLLTSTWSCAQDLPIPVYCIHDFSECVTVIFSDVTVDDVIRKSCLLDILHSSIHKLSEFYLSDPSHMPSKIRFRGVLSHDVRWVVFIPNILDINILFFHHVQKKMMTNINMICKNTYLPVLRWKICTLVIIINYRRLFYFGHFSQQHTYKLYFLFA